MRLKPTNVFTPNDFPRHTYVNRLASPPLEQQLRQALSTPKEVISISGPSKSGKSVLIEGIIGADNLITVSGAEIKVASDLWERVLDWMGAPSSSTVQQATTKSSGKSGSMSASGGAPMGIFRATAQGSVQGGQSDAITTGTTRNRGGIAQVEDEIGNSSYCVLVDDFHYIPLDVQVDVGRQIKTAAERGVRIITASVPHRSDDVVRSNHELRGRTNNIDTGFWNDDDLLAIAYLGFRILNVEVSDTLKRLLARDACGSPQLMQRICLNVCINLNIIETYDTPRRVADDEVNVPQVMAVTSASTDYRTLVQAMHAGPKTRGTDRAKFNFIDGSRGDVYRCILLALAQDPPQMELPYQALMERVKKVCVSESPLGRSVTEACKQISDFAIQNRTVEFDTDQEETFYIADPYWLFYLRASPKLKDLAPKSVDDAS